MCLYICTYVKKHMYIYVFLDRIGGLKQEIRLFDDIDPL